jgi:regulator of protease activity HflC (stomatin/prohibitin superfamily)
MSRYWDEKAGDPRFGAITRDFLLGLIALIAAGMYGCPHYEVYQQSLTGKAALGRAMQDRQIAVQEAQAKMESATLLAQAEIARAKGVAGANAIIAESLKGNETYLRYLWITEVAAVGKEGKTVVYVPTEANLPILEAMRKP